MEFLMTHEHSDHIQGLGVFSRKYAIPIYATPGTIRGIEKSFQSWKNAGRVIASQIETDKMFQLGDIDYPSICRFRMMQMNHRGYRIGKCRKSSCSCDRSWNI